MENPQNKENKNRIRIISTLISDRHAIVHENRDLLKCDACGKQFLGDKALKYHMKNVHKKNLR